MNVSKMSVRQSGFTLIEIAIVLVIIGLLLGGVLKGQELINSAKVRSLNDKVSGISAAYYAFQDRYKAIPGDYSRAQDTINDSLFQGNGNGVIDYNNETGSVWEHLEKAGFITGNFDGGRYGAGQACPQGRCPDNGFGGTLSLNWTNLAQERQGAKNELKSGRFIPSEILAELDRKVDDDIAVTGNMQISINTAGWNQNANCLNSDNNEIYATTTQQANCAVVFRNF